MKLTIERRSVLDLVPYQANSKHHGAEDISAIGRSIERFGFNDPIAVTPEGIIVEGHGRWQAVQDLGWTEVPVLVIEGLTEDQFDLYRIAHNKIALTSTFNFSALFGALQEIVGSDNGIVFADMGFNDKTVNELFSHFGDQEDEVTGGGIVPSVAASSSPIGYEIIWETKDEKAILAQFLAAEVEAGGDKSMGGELLLAAVAARDPDLWAVVTREVPGEVNLDQIAGQTEAAHVHA